MTTKPFSQPTKDALLNDFAIRSFRDTADGDYIAARFACRAALLPQFLWASQQAVEKYLKCILLLNRIEAVDVGHSLDIAMLRAARLPGFPLTKPTVEFIEYLDTYGRFRYLDVPQWGAAFKIFELDRAVWELRRFCTMDLGPRRVVEANPVPRVRLPGGHLEKIVDGHRKKLARLTLLWQNAFFGPRKRRTVRVPNWDRWANAPLAQNPDLLDDVAKYVKVPKELKTYWRERAAARGLVGP